MKQFLCVAAAALLLVSCDKTSNSPEESKGPVITSEKQKFTVDTVASGLDNPWGIAFLPDGRTLVTELNGQIRIIKDGKLLEETITNVPAVVASGQGGLLDIKLHPDYANNGWIYLTYSKPGEGGAATTLARTKLQGNAFVETEELFTALPFTSTGHHFGSRVVFDGNGYIFLSSGERGTKENSQDLGNHLGKIIRLHEDGKVPTDNPFVNTPNAKAEIWSYGHRNPQGLFYDKATSTLWEVEHGPKGGDELNKVEKGKNYGWPVITYGIDYSGEKISDITTKEGMEQPVWYWVPSIATCGMTMVTSDKYPNWKGNVLVGALALTHIARVELNNGTYVKHEKLLDGIGRVRAVEQSPDGFIYAAVQGPGMIVKIVPAE
jgi:glucose/arabinose dehydrogenase